MLNKLEDYIFLSDRGSLKYYIVERDGQVWLPDECPDLYFAENRRINIVFNWREAVRWNNHPSWKWRKGFLPVLEITDSNNILELAFHNDMLLVRINRQKAIYPESGVELGNDCCEKFFQETQSSWESFFASGWHPPASEFPDCAWKACFVQALNAFCGKHPRYGTGYYSNSFSDGFPPTIISMVKALIAYKHDKLAMNFLSYYLKRFVLPDGTIDYYGPALSEYGMLLDLSFTAGSLPDGKDWLLDNFDSFRKMANYIYRLRNEFLVGGNNKIRLLAGTPEADTKDEAAIYLHNNAWLWRGLSSWNQSCCMTGNFEAAAEAWHVKTDIEKNMYKILEQNKDSNTPVAARIDRLEAVHSYTQNRLTTYTNYRYYPELLEAGFLPVKEAMKIIKSREQLDGELEGMTYFHFSTAFDLNAAPYCCDNWPLASYAKALASLGEKQRLERLLTGHFLYHQSRDTFTAYESVDAQKNDIRRAFTDWCVPAQLVYPRVLKMLCEL